MRRTRTPSCATLLVITGLLLPFALSCSGEKGTDAAKGTDRDRVPPDDPETVRLGQTIGQATASIRHDANGVDERGELAYARRAQAYAQKGHQDKAIADYTEAIRLYPIVKGPYYTARLTEARNARAAAYAKSGDQDKAIADYTEVIQSTPPGGKDISEALINAGILGTAYYRRGTCYDAKGEHDKAKVDYNEAIRIAPELASATDVKQRLNK